MDDSRRIALVTLGVGAATVASWYLFHNYLKKKPRKKLPTQWEEVGNVSQLVIFPLKSAKGIHVTQAEATTNGLEVGLLSDRSFMVISEDGLMVTGRQAEMLVTLKTSFSGKTLTMTDLSGDSVSVDIGEVNNNNQIIHFKMRGDALQGVDCGEKAAKWLTKILYRDEKRVRLVYVGKQKWTRPDRVFAGINIPSMEPGDTTMYHDSSSYNLATESSLADLNSKLTDPVSMDYFRATIITTGSKAYDEDDWKFIKIGDSVVLHFAKPCERCLLTHLNPENGEKVTRHIDELKKNRTIVEPADMAKNWFEKPIFSIQCGINSTGTVRVGDKVRVFRDPNPYWKVNSKV